MELSYESSELRELSNISKELTRKEHDSIREYRRQLYENRSSEEKINDILTGFRFSLKNYADKENPEEG